MLEPQNPANRVSEQGSIRGSMYFESLEFEFWGQTPGFFLVGGHALTRRSLTEYLAKYLVSA